MRKPTDNLFKILTEAIKLRNPYGIDKSIENDKQLFLKPYDEPDYTYHGVYKSSRPNKDINLYKSNNYAQLRLKRKKLKGDIEKIKSEEDQPMLFDAEMESSQLHAMQKDMKNLSIEIDAIKKVRGEQVYPEFLRKILTSFFTIPGASMSKRYIFLPLKRNFTMAQIAILNKQKTINSDMLQDLFGKHEVVKDKKIDIDLIRYLKNIDYVFKTEDDLYNNICYTKNGAKVKISDELNKINMISIADKERSLKNSKDIKKIFFIQREIDKKRNLKSEFINRIEIIESEIFQTDKRDDVSVIVLTWVPRMIMSQSTETIWQSCMSLPSRANQGGVNKHFVKSGIENGVFIAWLVNINDIKNIDKPKARILIKPFRSSNGYVWLPSRIYHDGSVSNDLQIFKQAVNTFCFIKQKQVLTVAAKKQSQLNVDPRIVYRDNGDENKRVVTLKEIFRKINSKEDLPIGTEFNIYYAVDFTTIKAMAYLKKLDPETININMTKLISNTLREQNITIFNHLANINPNAINMAMEIYISSTLFEKDYQIKENFFSFLSKYYFNKVNPNIRYDFIKKIFQNGLVDKINIVIKNDPSVFFNTNDKKNNFNLIYEMIRSIIRSRTTSVDINHFFRFINAFMKKAKVLDFFSLSEIHDADSFVEVFYYLDKQKENDMGQENVKLWQSFSNQLETTNKEKNMLDYIQKNMGNYFHNIDKSDMFKKRYLDYFKKVLNSEDNKNVMEQVSVYLIRSAQAKEIIDIVKEKNDFSQYSYINLVIILGLEQKEFEKKINDIFDKNKIKEIYNDLFDIVKNKFEHLFDYDQTAQNVINKHIIDIENKLLFILKKYGNDSINRTQSKKIIFSYLDLSEKLNKNFLISLEADKILSEANIANYIGVYYANSRINKETFDNFKNKIEFLISLMGKKTLTLDKEGYAKKMFFGYRSDFMNDKFIEFFLQIFDFKDIVKYIIKNTKKIKNADYDEIRKQNEFITSYYFNLKDTKILNEFLKSKIELNPSFMNNVISITVSADNKKEIEKKLENKQLVKNIRDFFRNDFNYAIETVVSANSNYQNKNYYLIINALIMAFGLSLDDFVKMDLFKNLLKKNNKDIFTLLPAIDKKNVEKYLMSTIDNLSDKQNIYFEFLKYIEEKEADEIEKNKKPFLKDVLDFYYNFDFSVNDEKDNVDMLNDLLGMLARMDFLIDIGDIELFTKRLIDIIDNKFSEEGREEYYEFYNELYFIKDQYADAIRVFEDKNQKEKEHKYQKAYHDYLNSFLYKYMKSVLRNNDAVFDVVNLPSENIKHINLLITANLNKEEKKIFDKAITHHFDKFEMIDVNYKIVEKTEKKA